MMNRIDALFKRLAAAKRKGFIAYIAAGDPSPSHTAPIVREMEKNGADIVELGVPFSDPLADGVVNQRASERALSKGVDMAGVLRMVRAVRQRSDVPLVLFTYLNPVYSYGFKKFARDAAKAGVDGVLSLDLPPEEAAEYMRDLGSCGLRSVFLIAPTTPPERAKLIARQATGFIYYVSRTGVTGERKKLEPDYKENIERLKRITRTPVALGFGISTPGQVRAAALAADAVVVGSALVKEIERNQDRRDVAALVGRKVRRLSAPLRLRRRSITTV